MPKRPARNQLVDSKLSNDELLRARHAQIVDCATPLFLKKGFHSTTTRDIAAALGWNIGTLYLYIKAKEDILYLISNSIMEELFGGIPFVPIEATIWETLWAKCRHMFLTVDKLHPKVRLIYRETASMKPEHIAAAKESETDRIRYFADIIRQGVRCGEFRKVDAELLAYDIIMLSHMWALKGWSIAKRMTIEEYFDLQMQIVFAALAAPKPER